MILFNKLKFLPIILFAVLMLNCSSSVDTSKFKTEEYYNYAYKLYEKEDYELALQEFQNFVLQFSGSAFFDKAQFYLGMTYYKRKQYLLGAYEFSKLIKNIPASSFVPDAQYMLADSYSKLSPSYQLDQTYTRKAIEEYQAFIDFFPKDPKVDEADKQIKILNEKLAQKDYQSALIYERMDYSKAAMKYYGSVAEVFHDTKFAPMALYRKIMIELNKSLTNDAVSDIGMFLNRYPNDSNAKEIHDLEVKLTSK